MALIAIGDVATVRGLQNNTQYNGRVGVVSKFIEGDFGTKCLITLRATTTAQVPDSAQEKQLILMLRYLHVEVSYTTQTHQRLAQPMTWGSDQARIAFESEWMKRIDQEDLSAFRSCKREIYLYLVAQLGQRLRTTSRIGQAGWRFHGKRVKDVHYGCLWGHGGKEQEAPLDESNVHDAELGGSSWWPIIWVEPEHEDDPMGVESGVDIATIQVLVPVYCPGLAWQRARPWWAHVSRIREIVTPGVIIEELDEDQIVSDVFEREEWKLV